MPDDGLTTKDAIDFALKDQDLRLKTWEAFIERAYKILALGLAGNLAAAVFATPILRDEKTAHGATFDIALEAMPRFAAGATFVWWYTPAYPIANNIALCVMVLCSVSTVVFNANPLMRYDGYYVLADWIEIPNLRERANRFLKNLFLEHALGVEVQPEPYMALWRRCLFVLYAVVSYIYRWVITFFILWFMYSFLKPYKLGVVSGMLALAALGSMIGWPAWRTGSVVPGLILHEIHNSCLILLLYYKYELIAAGWK